MALKQTDDNVFESLSPAWPPAPFKRAFGGHVYAQAVYAASKTVEKGLVVHVRSAKILGAIRIQNADSGVLWLYIAGDGVFSPSRRH